MPFKIKQIENDALRTETRLIKEVQTEWKQIKECSTLYYITRRLTNIRIRTVRFAEQFELTVTSLDHFFRIAMFLLTLLAASPDFDPSSEFLIWLTV